MNIFRQIILFFLVLFLSISVKGEDVEVISETAVNSDVEEIGKTIIDMTASAWRVWQDGVIIDNVYVEGSRGILFAGGLSGNIFKSYLIFEQSKNLIKDRGTLEYIKATADAFSMSMRNWQLGYTHDNIPFPQGASCVYTLTSCYNLAVSVSSGNSTGARMMEEETLYNSILYNLSVRNEKIFLLSRALAKTFSFEFARWQDSCFIADIQAKGGIAPQPAPIGVGPGQVKGAKGNNGKLKGAYFDAEEMKKNFIKYLDDLNKKRTGKSGVSSISSKI
ncbi:secreted protein [Candidatus Omnitrophus magneticus]|uniref:Secreted protein n=1 Tax=Candidatus Omnitrophus magneticus TaxID=1609969 RepID=A0A0F0CTT9_9BACT|nr:secreted protein [Candidatus Omnitrophus magneticus]